MQETDHVPLKKIIATWLTDTQREQERVEEKRIVFACQSTLKSLVMLAGCCKYFKCVLAKLSWNSRHTHSSRGKTCSSFIILLLYYESC